MTLNDLKAFTPVGKLETGKYFRSEDVKLVVHKGLEAASEHAFFVLDAPSGAGATVALNALRQDAKKDPKIILVELGAYPISQRSNLRGLLWKDLIIGMGQKPAYRWGDWIDKKGITKQGRRLQLRDLLFKLYESGKKVLIVMDEALSQPRHIWELLYQASRINVENAKYGPGVVICANLADKIARYKPDYIVEEGKAEFPDFARRSSFKLGGLTPDEVTQYIAFQAYRDGKSFDPGFLKELNTNLTNSYLTGSGLHRLPATINAVGRNLMELYHKRGHQIYTALQKAVARRALAGVER